MPPKSGFKKGASADNPDRIADRRDKSRRDRATITRLNMYKGGKPIRDKEGAWRSSREGFGPDSGSPGPGCAASFAP